MDICKRRRRRARLGGTGQPSIKPSDNNNIRNGQKDRQQFSRPDSQQPRTLDRKTSIKDKIGNYQQQKEINNGGQHQYTDDNSNGLADNRKHRIERQQRTESTNYQQQRMLIMKDSNLQNRKTDRQQYKDENTGDYT